MYRENPFHSFEHASHVAASVTKLLSRIVAPVDLEDKFSKDDDDDDDEHYEVSLHDHTYGITSDPLTQFACTFSALIHDVDHSGISNKDLQEENKGLSEVYNNRSIAEQNSLELSWNLLSQEAFSALREAICPTEAEALRFRKLVVNSVMATDIVDKEMKGLRDARWKKAFAEGEDRVEEHRKTQINRKATIVIEHLIQASDISHTMQHWHVYRKWNERLFEEMYAAYRIGRSQANPADFWAKGEIGFFDFYIIPLAKKLKDCGVFGVSSDEFLNYAESNRSEWVARGEEVVAEMVEKFSKREYHKAQYLSVENVDNHEDWNHE